VIKRIRSEREYEETLDVISVLMDADLTQDNKLEELERLAEMVEEYEKEHYPMD